MRTGSKTQDNPKLKKYYNETMAEINEAYEVLSDTDKRKAYDRERQEQARRERERQEWEWQERERRAQEVRDYEAKKAAQVAAEQEAEQWEKREKRLATLFTFITASVPLLVMIIIGYIVGEADETNAFVVKWLSWIIPVSALLARVIYRRYMENPKRIPLVSFFVSLFMLILFFSFISSYV